MKTKIIASIIVLMTLSCIALYAEDYERCYPVEFSYKMSVKSGKGFSGDNPSVIKITYKENGYADITLPCFVFSESMTVGSFIINNVNVTIKESGDLLLSLSDFSSTDGRYDIKGYSLEGCCDDEDITLRVIYKAGKMPFRLTVEYQNN